MGVEALCFQPAHKSLFKLFCSLPRVLISNLEPWVGQDVVGGEKDRNLPPLFLSQTEMKFHLGQNSSLIPPKLLFFFYLSHPQASLPPGFLLNTQLWSLDQVFLLFPQITYLPLSLARIPVSWVQRSWVDFQQKTMCLSKFLPMCEWLPNARHRTVSSTVVKIIGFGDRPRFESCFYL